MWVLFFIHFYEYVIVDFFVLFLVIYRFDFNFPEFVLGNYSDKLILLFWGLFVSCI
ncbi:hypothetical protein PRUB_a4647 [Pseudoalteromonas rubra]|uniref:Uncharacterized protein n=1 Tax=Pseudoalteromonas rubra TaxID=43658 RepID=A0A8T0CBW3_9GAMM|nr:hypothetical protein PRUB_a4639 [Pseudoalteromonas rubra]KAF7787537.1 hypothetical protein PRUB_a4642 [Pseudoalteromonas rubra]KAF7787541.1 hypothetical protein PRUB_a4647 [Pseudoalteromonas rubra]